MQQKECPKCETRAGLNFMKGEVSSLMDVATNTPMVIDWTCGFCGYKDHDEIYMSSMAGAQNTKSMINPPDPFVVEEPAIEDPPVEDPPVEP